MAVLKQTPFYNIPVVINQSLDLNELRVWAVFQFSETLFHIRTA